MQSSPKPHKLNSLPEPPSSQSPSLARRHVFVQAASVVNGDGGGGGNGDGGSLDSDDGESSDTLQMHLLTVLHGLPPRRGLLIILPVVVWKKQPLGIH